MPCWIHPFCQEKNFNLSFSINLMMAAILNSAILASAILPKKNFIHSFWLNLMMAAILNSTLLNLAMVDSAILHKTLTQTNSIWLKLFHFHLTWWWWPSWIWLFWIQQSLYFLSNSLTLAKIGFHHLHKKLHSFIVIQLDECSHLEFCHLEFGHLGFCYLSIFFQTHSHLPRLVPTICTKHFLHSF